MLNKLIKHEFNATGKYLLPIYGILLVLSLINRLILTLDIFHGALSIIPAFFEATYFISIVAVVIVTFVLMIIRFYKNLLSDEGYLMFTLPVTPRELITSKLLVSIVWNCLSIIGVLVSLLIVFATPANMQEISSIFREFIAELNSSFGTSNTALLLAEFTVMIIFSLTQTVLLIYVSIAVGQLFSGHKLLGSFAAYIGINTVVQIVMSLIIAVGGYAMRGTWEDLNSIPQILLPVIILIVIVMSILYFIATEYIFRKKLNLE